MPITGTTVTGIDRWTWLYLTQRLALECGVSKDPWANILTLVGATEDVLRLASWIQSAWRDIQDLEPNWKFMRRSCVFDTLAGQFEYTADQAGIPADTFGRWKLDSFRCYPTGNTNGEMPMGTLDYDEWRDTYQFGSYRNVITRPFVVTELPDLSLGLGPTPPVGYTIVGDYYAAPKDLANGTEVPLLPARHNPLIVVYKAMMSYGSFEGAPEVYDRGKREHDKLISRLRMYELPQIRFGGPLC